MRFVVFLLITLASGADGIGQSIDYFPLQKRDGLASNFIYDLSLDSNNLLWIGTNNGLDLFNGRSIKHYTIEDGLVNNFITTLAHGSKGELWIGHHTGDVSKFDGNGFTHYNLGSEERVISIIPLDDQTTAIVQDNSNSFYYLFQDTLIPIFNDEQVKPSKLVQTSRSVLYAIYPNSIKRVDPNTWKISEVLKMRIQASGHTSIGDEIFAVTSDAILLQNESEFRILEQFEVNDRRIELLSKAHWTDDGNIWSIDNDTLFYFKYNGKSLLTGNKFSIKEANGLRNVTAIVQTENHLIIASKSKGVYHFPLPEAYHIESNLILPRKALQEISNKELLIGEGKKITHFTRRTNSSNQWARRNLLVLDHEVTAIKKVSAYRSVYAKKNGEIHVLNHLSFTSTRIAQIQDEITNISIDKTSRLWVSTLTKGVYVFSTNGKEIAHYDTSNRLSHNFNKEVYHDAFEGVWFLSEKSKLTYMNGSYTRYFGRDDGISNLDFTSILEDSQDRIWISTEDGQVHLFKDSTFVQIPFSLKPEKTRVMKLFHQDSSMIAVANKGIYWIDESTGEAYAHRSLNQSKVINEFQNGMIALDSSLVIANEGAIWFVPKQANRKNKNRTPWVTNWKCNGEVLGNMVDQDYTSIRTLQANVESYQIDEERPYWYRDDRY